MSDIAIKVENISKLYHIGAKKSGSLRETLEHSFNKLIGKKDDIDKAEEFWALKDINFEIKKGEAVGIIGRNGAGKSTLLKILSRITEPTTGKITINGRVASLLEVGTGFHPELTGRENIFMNGAILGMKQAEIKAKFDEIVDFSGIEKFIDTPVKHYSSGMYVRLAFAVAAHLEPEILIIDEVLAVGDAEFQKKCLGKMNDVSSKEGKTIVFVSHDLVSVKSLCKEAILIGGGGILDRDISEKVVEKYLSENLFNASCMSIRFSDSKTNPLWMTRAILINETNPNLNFFYNGDALKIEVDFKSTIPLSYPTLGFVIKSQSLQPILNANNFYQKTQPFKTPITSGKIICELGSVPLISGKYFISLWLSQGAEFYHHEDNCLLFEVLQKDIWGNGRFPPAITPMWWRTKFSIKDEIIR